MSILVQTKPRLVTVDAPLIISLDDLDVNSLPGISGKVYGGDPAKVKVQIGEGTQNPDHSGSFRAAVGILWEFVNTIVDGVLKQNFVVSSVDGESHTVFVTLDEGSY